MNTKNNKVLVLGNDTRSFLTVIRSLGREGLKVHVAFCDKGEIALESKYINTVHNNVHHNGKLLVDEFIELLQSESFDLVIPMTDAIHAQIQLNREILRDFPELPILPRKCYETTSSKLSTLKVSQKLGINVSKYCVVKMGEDYSTCHAGFKFPIVIKPLASVALHNPSCRLNVEKAFTEEDYQKLMGTMLQASDVVIQENFIGIGTGVECLAKDGNILTAFQHQREHEPIHGGGSSYRKSVPLHSEMYTAAKKLTKDLNYTGVIMYEFKLNETTGEWIIIEINARFWGSLPLAVSAGINFPYYYYQMMVEGRLQFNKEYKSRYCRNLELDMWWFIANLRADKNDPYLATKPIWKVFTEVWNILTLKERIDTITIDDPTPGLQEIRHLAGFFFKKATSKIFFKLLNTNVFSAARQRYALSRIKRANNVVIVCTGNICRSPFAELYFSKKYPKKRVLSAGSIQKSGRPSPENAQKAALSLDIDLASHRSQIITKSMISESDVVIFFDRFNYEGLLSTSFMNIGKYLPITAHLERMDIIDDPYGENVNSFKTCYQEIISAIDQMP